MQIIVLDGFNLDIDVEISHIRTYKFDSRRMPVIYSEHVKFFCTMTSSIYKRWKRIRGNGFVCVARS